MKSRLLGAMCASLFSFISIPSHAALVDNGGGLIYDDVLDITWAQPDALRTWDNANTWAAGLTLGGSAAAVHRRSGRSGPVYWQPRQLQHGPRTCLSRQRAGVHVLP